MKILYIIFALVPLFFSSCSLIGFGIAMSMDDTNYHDISNTDSLKLLKSPAKIRVSGVDGNTYKGTFKNFRFFNGEKVESDSAFSNSFADTVQKEPLWELSFKTGNRDINLNNIEVREIEKYSSSGAPSGVVIVVLGIVIDLILIYTNTNSSSFSVGG